MDSRSGVAILTLFLTVFLLNFAGTYGASELSILSSPPYMKFTKYENDEIRTSELVAVLDACVGFTSQEDSSWNGLKSGSPFHYPRVLTLFQVPGFDGPLGSECEGLKYPAIVDSDPSWIFSEMADHIQARYPEQQPNSARMDGSDAILPEYMRGGPVEPSKQSSNLDSDSSILKDFTLTSLDASSAPDRSFLMQCQQVKEFGAACLAEKKALQKSQAVDLFVFQMDGMQRLVSTYGADSPQVREASQLLCNSIKQLSNTLSKIYDKDRLELLLTYDKQMIGEVGKTRRTRGLLQSEPGAAAVGESLKFTANSTTNVGEVYNQDYPAIFNIIFLTMLIISLSIFAIALGMWHMDPGRDSIIYRMTSQRMKKDN